MKLPKVVFKVMPIEKNIGFIQWGYFESTDVLSVHDYTIKLFPELANIDNSLSEEEINKQIEEVVEKEYLKKEKLLQERADKYNQLWAPYNDQYLETLSNFFGIVWPSDLEEIEATVGILPVYPRHLDTCSFSIGTGVTDLRLINVCAHEILHFIWFRKLQQMHPEIPRREYDSPYFPWQYSEMVTDPILNNPPFDTMFEFKEIGYNSFYKMEYNGEKVMDVLRNIYAEEIPIEEKIDKGYAYISEALGKDNKQYKK